MMGLSGSRKTTLLNVLAGQLVASPRLHLTGDFDVNGELRSSGGFKIAYVRQKDLFFLQMTVWETLSLAVEIQLHDVISIKKRNKYVNKLLFKLGLINCTDSIIGDAKVRGISGGEKKHLSLACELIASPSVIFADEPTTGLDAFQAERVMETLRQLAQDGHTVICSIQQPRGSIYNKFDDIMLLSEGAVVYIGPAKDVPLTYIVNFGYQNVNPIFLGQTESLTNQNFFYQNIAKQNVPDQAENVVNQSFQGQYFANQNISSKKISNQKFQG